MIIVDRIEGSFAVAEDNGRRINIKRCFLPPDVKEGDVLVRKGLRYEKDINAANARRAQNRSLEKGLWK